MCVLVLFPQHRLACEAPVCGSNTCAQVLCLRVLTGKGNSEPSAVVAAMTGELGTVMVDSASSPVLPCN
jgi:hypothetical protein